jgi:hypothetical protein
VKTSFTRAERRHLAAFMLQHDDRGRNIYHIYDDLKRETKKEVFDLAVDYIHDTLLPFGTREETLAMLNSLDELIPDLTGRPSEDHIVITAARQGRAGLLDIFETRAETPRVIEQKLATFKYGSSTTSSISHHQLPPGY